MPIKISKAVKDLNIGMQTARDFLKKNEIEVDDNINARISDEAYNLLIQKFKPAMQQKKAAEQIIHDRKEEKAAQAAEKKRREAETVEVAIQKPKVLGKIELDAKGNPVAPKPAAPEAPKAEEVKMEEKKAEEQKPAPAALPKEDAKPKPAAAEPKKEEKAPAEPKVEKPQPVAETPVVEQKKEDAPAPAPQAEPETISNAPRMQGPKVVGKIDLSALNQSTRPKKKTKEEKRNERINKEKARQGANADGEKRKLKKEE